VLFAVTAASIAFALRVAPERTVHSLGQTVSVGTAPPTWHLKGPGQAVLFGQVIPTQVDFYGPVRDAINGADDTDRLVVEWATAGDEGPGPITSTATDALVATPADIVALRAADPAAARRARVDVREAVGERMAQGWVIAGVDAEGRYVLRPPS